MIFDSTSWELLLGRRARERSHHLDALVRRIAQKSWLGPDAPPAPALEHARLQGDRMPAGVHRSQADPLPARPGLVGTGRCIRHCGAATSPSRRWAPFRYHLFWWMRSVL